MIVTLTLENSRHNIGEISTSINQISIKVGEIWRSTMEYSEENSAQLHNNVV
jgi:hypothetical protein